MTQTSNLREFQLFGKSSTRKDHFPTSHPDFTHSIFLHLLKSHSSISRIRVSFTFSNFRVGKENVRITKSFPITFYSSRNWYSSNTHPLSHSRNTRNRLWRSLSDITQIQLFQFFSSPNFRYLPSNLTQAFVGSELVSPFWTRKEYGKCSHHKILSLPPPISRSFW